MYFPASMFGMDDSNHDNEGLEGGEGEGDDDLPTDTTASTKEESKNIGLPPS
jgi:hypothetical protein